MQIEVIDSGLFTKTPAAVVWTARALPSGITTKAARPVFVQHRRCTVILGRFSRGVAFYDNLNAFFKYGMTPPSTDPVLANGGGGTLTGESIGYYTWRHKDGATLVAESAPSGPSATVTHLNGQRVWTLPAVANDSRATHIALYVEWNGTPAGFVQEVAVGTTTVTEQVGALSFGDLMNYDGGEPPYCIYGEKYRARVFLAGDPDYPNRIYYSEEDNPESVDPLSFFKTTSGEAVTGLKRIGESLMITTINTIDILTGWTEDDFFVRPFSPSVGCISGYAMVNIHDRVWFPSQTGIYVYDGSLKYVSEDLRDWWVTEYAANPTQFEAAIAWDNPEDYTYNFCPQYGDKTYNPVAFYLPFEPSVGGGGGQPWWSFDRMGRRTTAVGKLTTGSRRYKLFHGSTDGYTREMNVAANADDDSDTFEKAVEIQTKHYLMEDPGGDVEEGKRLLRLWCYFENENNECTVEIRAGDESAEDMSTPSRTKTEPASLKIADGAVYVAKTVHPIDPNEVSGRGFTFTFRVTAPEGFRWRGLGGTWSLGAATRGRV